MQCTFSSTLDLPGGSTIWRLCVSLTGESNKLLFNKINRFDDDEDKNDVDEADEMPAHNDLVLLTSAAENEGVKK